MPKEPIDLVDEQDNVIGITDVETAHASRQLHRVVAVFVFDHNENLILQKRVENGRYDNSVGGHVGLSESYSNAAKREMQEELGLDIPITEIGKFLPEDARLGHWWTLYTGVAPMGWEFEPTKEVQTVESMTVPGIVALMDTTPEKFTHGFINVMKGYVTARIPPLRRD